MKGSALSQKDVRARAVWILACATLTALSAKIAVWLPYTPVPVTAQVAAVLFSGLALGARDGAMAQVLYLLMGFAGAPVFAGKVGGIGYLLNPFGTGGYLLSYPLAAWVVGRIAERASDRFAPFRACAAGILVIYAVGVTWFALWLHRSPAEAFVQGAGWFVVWDAAKAVLAIIAATAMKPSLRLWRPGG